MSDYLSPQIRQQLINQIRVLSPKSQQLITAEPTSKVSVVPTPTISVVPTPTISVVPTPTISVVPTPTISVVPTPTISVEPTPKVSVDEQNQQLITEVSRLKKFVDTYEAQKAIRMQLKKDFINSYNIYLIKRKEYDDAEIDYKNYLINNRDYTFQVGTNGWWYDEICQFACEESRGNFPYFDTNYVDYKIKNPNSIMSTCNCIFPNLEILKKKLDIMNLKKKETEDALALSTNLKKKFEEALQEI